ncbi:MAG: hypothetical protein KDC38_15880 [Planctomycetes bacterium]|nr:hypothetical protein [Planctomycetota bacterium]
MKPVSKLTMTVAAFVALWHSDDLLHAAGEPSAPPIAIGAEPGAPGSGEDMPSKAPEVSGETTVECRLLYVTSDGLFVDVGTREGLTKGMLGSLEHSGRRIGRIEVASVAARSCFLRVEGAELPELPSAAALTLRLEATLTPAGPTDDEALRPDRTDFTPLLAPQVPAPVGVTDARNVFHGRLRLRQLYQSTTENDLDYLRTHAHLSGSLLRMDGTPWALEWGTELIYRSGDGYEDVDDFQELDPEVYLFSVFRRFDDKAMLRAGRFLPRELPSVGYLDGVQAETQIDPGLRAGVLFGFKPTRDDLEPTLKEIALVPYATIERGDGVRTHYSATAGLMGTLYETEPDRLALLVDQTARVGKLRLYSSSEVDADVGGFESREVVRLSRWNLSTHWTETWFGTLRAGVDHFELVDIEAERDLVDEIVLDESEYFDKGYWRSWVGATQSARHLVLREEIAYIDSPAADGLRWLAGITLRDFFGAPDASISIDVHNLIGDEIEGYGGRASAYFPFSGQRLYLQPSVVLRSVKSDLNDSTFEVTDISLHAHWVPSTDWRVVAGVSYGITDSFDRLLFDVGITFAW